MSNILYCLGVWYATESYFAIIEKAQSGFYIVIRKERGSGDKDVDYFENLEFARQFMNWIFFHDDEPKPFHVDEVIF